MKTQLQQNNSIQDVYGSFSLGATEFAISANSIKEVVNELDSYNSIPLSPDYMIGMFNLRGMIVPVVDLGKIFKIEDNKTTAEGDNRIIAIIEYGTLCVGLLFDKTGEVFYENPEERVQFSKENQQGQESVVQGVFKLDNGDRIIQIIDPHEVINLKQLPLPEETLDSNTVEKARKLKKCISFNVSGSTCAININAIREVLKIETIENSVLAGDNCLGAVNIRGNTIPIIDFGAFLGGGKTDIDGDSSSHTVIVMKVEDGFFGLLVTALENIISYYDEEIIPFPVLGNKKIKMFAGCISTENTTEITLLNHDEIFSDNEINAITSGHGNLYKEHCDEGKTEKQTKDFKKETYIIFSIEDSYALEISTVNEVIDYPGAADIIVPPGLPENVKGMINLRGDLIVIVDSRALYNMPSYSNTDTPKVLIFIDSGTKYGLVVDSIDSIVSFANSQALKVPSFSQRGSAVDIKKALQIRTTEEAPKTLLVMDIQLIVSKLGMNISDVTGLLPAPQNVSTLEPPTVAQQNSAG